MLSRIGCCPTPPERLLNLKRRRPVPPPTRSPPPRRHRPKPPPPMRRQSGGREKQPRRGPVACENGRRGIALGQHRWRRQPKRRRSPMLPSCELKGLSLSPATSTAGVVLFPPLQLRWRPILRAFLPLLPREPRTRPQGLTPPLLPRKPQLRPLGPTLSHNQCRAHLPLRVLGPPLFRAPYLLREPLPWTLGSTRLRHVVASGHPGCIRGVFIICFHLDGKTDTAACFDIIAGGSSSLSVLCRYSFWVLTSWVGPGKKGHPASDLSLSVFLSPSVDPSVWVTGGESVTLDRRGGTCYTCFCGCKLSCLG